MSSFTKLIRPCIFIKVKQKIPHCWNLLYFFFFFDNFLVCFYFSWIFILFFNNFLFVHIRFPEVFNMFWTEFDHFSIIIQNVISLFINQKSVFVYVINNFSSLIIIFDTFWPCITKYLKQTFKASANYREPWYWIAIFFSGESCSIFYFPKDVINFAISKNILIIQWKTNIPRFPLSFPLHCWCFQSPSEFLSSSHLLSSWSRW